MLKNFNKIIIEYQLNINQLIEVSKVLEKYGMTPEVARDLVTLIIKLKE